MKCPNCKKEIENDSVYCEFCGTKIMVDLGLPSGTLWGSQNIGKNDSVYTSVEVLDYDNHIPTKDQWVELKNLCYWEWLGNGYKVIGPNGNSIIFPLSAAFDEYDWGLSGVYFCSSIDPNSNRNFYSFALHENDIRLTSIPLDFKMLRLVHDNTCNVREMVDLGLPSGTLWSNHNEYTSAKEAFFTYPQAVETFEKHTLPTKEQWKELHESCKWSWEGEGYKIVGPNKNSITLPAMSGHFADSNGNDVGPGGCYWSFCLNRVGVYEMFFFYAKEIYISSSSPINKISVRLVGKKKNNV